MELFLPPRYIIFCPQKKRGLGLIVNIPLTPRVKITSEGKKFQVEWGAVDDDGVSSVCSLLFFFIFVINVM